MDAQQIAALVAAGAAAGTINTIVGSGTLVTFPMLLAFGYPAVTANVSNTIGLVAGGLTGTWGYRTEVKRNASQLAKLAPFSLVGAIIGAVLLLVLPSTTFDAVVPVLIALGIALVLAGPWLNKRAASAHSQIEGHGLTPGRATALNIGILGAGMYGGYFGAAQGVLLMGIMSSLLPIALQEINGIKNVLGTIVNAVAAITFIIVAPEHVNWAVAGLIALGAFLGGIVGARLGRKLNPWALRAFIVIVGVAAIINLLG